MKGHLFSPMSLEVKIPAVGESITSGVIAAWHKKDGDIVQANEPILTLETDKVSSEIVAAGSGRLTIQAKEGDEVKIGQTVALIEEGVSAPAAGSPAAPPPTPRRTSSRPPRNPTPAHRRGQGAEPRPCRWQRQRQRRRPAAFPGRAPVDGGGTRFARRDHRHRQGRTRHQGRRARVRREPPGIHARRFGSALASTCSRPRRPRAARRAKNSPPCAARSPPNSSWRSRPPPF